MSGQTDQSRPASRVSVVEALTQIRALCRDAWSEGGYEGGDAVISADEVRAVLDAVSVDATPPQGIDRDALIAALRKALQANGVTLQSPGGTIDGILWDIADTALALVRPVEGGSDASS